MTAFFKPVGSAAVSRSGTRQKPSKA